MDPVLGSIIVASIASIPASIAAWASLGARKATTKNGGKNNPPTVPDRLHRLEGKVDLLLESQADHLAWSKEETAELWRAIGRR